MSWTFYDFRELEKWQKNWDGFCSEYGIRYRIFANLHGEREKFRVVLDL